MKVLTQPWPTNREGQKKPAFTSLVGEKGLVLSGEEPLVMVGLPAGPGWWMRNAWREWVSGAKPTASDPCSGVLTYGSCDPFLPLTLTMPSSERERTWLLSHSKRTSKPASLQRSIAYFSQVGWRVRNTSAGELTDTM